jgi:hypothetical protein
MIWLIIILIYPAKYYWKEMIWPDTRILYTAKSKDYGSALDSYSTRKHSNSYGLFRIINNRMEKSSFYKHEIPFYFDVIEILTRSLDED